MWSKTDTKLLEPRQKCINIAVKIGIDNIYIMIINLEYLVAGSRQVFSLSDWS